MWAVVPPKPSVFPKVSTGKSYKELPLGRSRGSVGGAGVICTAAGQGLVSGVCLVQHTETR